MSDTSSDTCDFNVFLSHNSKDKPAVRELKRLLVANGLTAWLDEDELRYVFSVSGSGSFLPECDLSQSEQHWPIAELCKGGKPMRQKGA
jgi:hypothetical protein